jgi:hypothetical protein
MNIKAVLVTIFLFFTWYGSSAQYGGSRHHYYQSYGSYNDNGKRTLKKMYAAFSLPKMTMDIDAKYVVNRSSPGSSGPSVDTSIHLSKMSGRSFGLSCGTFYNIARFDDKNMIALDVSFGFNYMEWDFGKVRFSSADMVSDKAFSLQFNLPLALVYKTGGEVKLDPNTPMLFSIGAGIAPTYMGSQYINASSGVFKVRSFVMAEIGAYIGIALKFRVSYYPSTLVYIDAPTNELPASTESGNFSVTGTGTGNFILSLLILPDSRRWGDN